MTIKKGMLDLVPLYDCDREDVSAMMVEIFAEGGRTAATAWLCAPDIEAAVGVEVFNQGPGTLLVNGVVAHTVASVSRLPWEPAFP